MRSYWENTIYVVKEQIGDNPVYKVVSEMDGSKSRVLHRKLLHLVTDLLIDLPATEKQTKPSSERKKKLKTAHKEAEPQLHCEASSDDDESSYYVIRYNLRNDNRHNATATCEPTYTPLRNSVPTGLSQTADHCRPVRVRESMYIRETPARNQSLKA